MGRMKTITLKVSGIGIGTALVGLLLGSDVLYWAGLFLAVPLYLCYALPMTILLAGILMAASAQLALAVALAPALWLREVIKKQGEKSSLG